MVKEDDSNNSSEFIRSCFLDPTIIHQTYNSRIHQLETWRHLQVLFIYSVIIPGIAYLTLGKNFNSNNIILWYVFFMEAFLVSTLGTIFTLWSQKRVLLLAFSLHTLENLYLKKLFKNDENFYL